jgi:hypothetical protein
MAATPTFAVIGAVNHGKSSVAATLAENDQVRISPMPGETVECQRFELGECFVFFDTPGFQNAREALAELRPAAQAGDPLALFRAFVERHRGEPEFEAECRLFAPLLEGAGVIYVVDGSQPLRDIHLAEMELLRLSGAPRLAIINSTGPAEHAAAWRRRLGQHFNAVRDFDAMRAGFAERVELLETLAGIEQAWKAPLMQAVTLLREDWHRRLDEAAAIIVALVAELLQHHETCEAPTERHRLPEVEAVLKQRYLRAVSRREAQAHQALIELFGHRLVQAGELPPQLLAEGVFSEAVWSVLGLSARQLLAAGAAAGAGMGAAADVLTAGHSLLAGSALGAALGAAGALALGKRRPELAIDLSGNTASPMRALLPQRLRLGGSTLRAGPYAALNFPWVLIDRAGGTLAYLMQRAHARRDRVTLNAEQLRELLARDGLASADWPDAERREAERAFADIRRGRFTPQAHEALNALLRRRLDVLAAAHPLDGGAPARP